MKLTSLALNIVVAFYTVLSAATTFVPQFWWALVSLSIAVFCTRNALVIYRKLDVS